MIKEYRKTATIKAEQVTEEANLELDYPFKIVEIEMPQNKSGEKDYKLYLKTLEGDMEVHIGDWIATGVNGEHWPIADDVFKKTYVEVER